MNNLRCSICGEPMLGDGYTTVVHCPNATGYEDREPDADFVECNSDSEEMRELCYRWAWTNESRDPVLHRHSELFNLAKTGVVGSSLRLERELELCFAQDEDEAEELNRLVKFIRRVCRWENFNNEAASWVAPWYNK